jgi:hypothetical protein
MTMTTETEDFDIVLQDPAAYYRLPQAIVDDAALSLAEKHALLAEWELDLADRSTATDEGMVPDAPELIDRDVKMHDRVIDARAALEAAGTGDAGFVSLAIRIWRRVTKAE